MILSRSFVGSSSLPPPPPGYALALVTCRASSDQKGSLLPIECRCRKSDCPDFQYNQYSIWPTNIAKGNFDIVTHCFLLTQIVFWVNTVCLKCVIWHLLDVGRVLLEPLTKPSVPDRIKLPNYWCDQCGLYVHACVHVQYMCMCMCACVYASSCPNYWCDWCDL